MRLLSIFLALLFPLMALAETVPVGDALRYQLAPPGVDCNSLAVSDARWARPGPGDIVANSRYCLQAVIARPQEADDQQALKVSLLGAYRLYWNQRYLGQGGVVGDAATERPGRLGSVHLLAPKHPITDSNLLRIELSTYHAHPSLKWLLHDVSLGNYADLLTRPMRAGIPVIAACGAMLLMAFYLLIVCTLEKRNKAHLLFAILCALFAALLVAEVWKELIGYNYDLHIVRLRLILALSCCIALALPCFYAAFYQLHTQPIKLAIGATAIAIAALIIDSYDLAGLMVLVMGMLASLAINVVALRRRLPFSRVNLLVLAVMNGAMLLEPATFADRWLFLMFPLLALALLLALSLEHRTQSQQAMRAIQLENDLLRRNLQPHFLMNSLTMVMEWIEQSPPKALLFIEALAAEFRQLSRCADQRLVSVADELQLCRSHLDIMGYRKERSYALDAEGVEPTLQVPPALLHTLLENAFSHNKLDYDARFSLSQEVQGKHVLLRFECPHDGRQRHTGTGMGLAYLRARLADAYGKHWSMQQQADGAIWRTSIQIPRSGA